MRNILGRVLMDESALPKQYIRQYLLSVYKIKTIYYKIL